MGSLIGGFNSTGKPALYQTDPSGAYFEWKATVIGKNSKTVQDFLEKKYEEDMDEETTLKLTLKALLEVTEASVQNIEVIILKKDQTEWCSDEKLEPLLKQLDDSAERMAKLKAEA